MRINDEIRSRVRSLEQLHLDCQFDTNLTPKSLEIKMKFHQFEQLFLIFIDNAIKYGVKNKKTRVGTKLKNKQKIIETTDHGIGIPEKDQDFIFDRFYRVDKSRSRSQDGNELGLSITQKVIQLNGGSIKIKGEINKGTTFRIIF